MAPKAKKPTDHLPKDGENITIDTPQGPITLGKFAPKAGFLRKHRNKTELDFMFTLVEKFADDEALEAFDELEIEEMKEFFKEWQEGSGAFLGES